MGIKYSNDVAAKAPHLWLTKSQRSHGRSATETRSQSRWDLCKIEPEEGNYREPTALLPDASDQHSLHDSSRAVH